MIQIGNPNRRGVVKVVAVQDSSHSFIDLHRDTYTIPV